MKLVLVGKLRSGKDTVAEILVSKYGFTRYAFGDALKRQAHALFPWVPAEPKPRALYQFMNVMRDYDPDVWVRHLFDQLAADQAARQRAGFASVTPVITDARQANEVARCQAEGFTVIHVAADEVTRLERAKAAGDDFDPAALRHVTETQLDDLPADYYVDNGAGIGLAELEAQVDEIIRQESIVRSNA